MDRIRKEGADRIRTEIRDGKHKKINEEIEETGRKLKGWKKWEGK